MELCVKNLVKTFGKTKALDDISFTLNPSEIVGIVGPNGSGKTTCMNIITALDYPDSGDVTLDGISIIDYPEISKKQIGFMPDYLPSESDITAHEYIDFFARAYGYKGVKLTERVREIESFVGLEPIKDKVLSALSRGMKQRVSLARAIIGDPAILVMDEPANGLDPRARLEFRNFAKTLGEMGKAILISSHILSDLSEICQSCIILEQGKLITKLDGDISKINLEEKYLELTKGAIQ